MVELFIAGVTATAIIAYRMGYTNGQRDKTYAENIRQYLRDQIQEETAR
jgi:hypothetical protein